ncbi:MAG: nicotinamide-nucleotide amidohydrolase family protein [Rhodococcus sp.]|uniref:CinA family protein n=1 Tax=Rhodococcus TaxID=1827 RepID=UPI0016AD317D|nr:MULTISPECIES: nicotinamide-nucleotide amidohydrolase family protein [Rhodococcus]NLV77969.1 nicotinamide-nucleotide amidohydrolase family protein [Rhodococcus sp. (in: high G+C Gram-positive bacteria)]
MSTVDPLVAATRAVELVAVLTDRGETVATAESLTAGLLSATVAGVPGASAVLRGGLVVYATDLKATLAGVDARQLTEDGPVAESTAAALAEGARDRCSATWGVGLTGVAGPDPQDGHPPGTLFVGIAGPGGTSVVCPAVAGDRWQIRLGAVEAAVSGLLAHLSIGPAL